MKSFATLGRSRHGVTARPTRLLATLHSTGIVQPHALSTGRLIFLIVLVVFFTALFIGAYLLMRRPNFGQGVKAPNRATSHLGHRAKP